MTTYCVKPKGMGRDDGRRDDWGRDAYYDRRPDRDHYRDRSYDRDDRRQIYGRDDRYGYGRIDRRDYGRDDRYNYNRDDRRGYGRDSYDRYERHQPDRYQSRGGRDRPYRGGSRGRGKFGGGDKSRQDQDEIDEEEQEYIKKRQEVLKARRAEEEQYVAEDVDTAALAAMGLPTGFGALQEREAIEEVLGLRNRGDVDHSGQDSTEPTQNQDRVEGSSDKNNASGEPTTDKQATIQTSEQSEPNGDSETKCNTEGEDNFTKAEDVSTTDPSIQESSQCEASEATAS